MRVAQNGGPPLGPNECDQVAPSTVTAARTPLLRALASR